MIDICSLDAYDYELPQDHIAQYPSNPPESCKLLTYNRSTKQLSHTIFADAVKTLDDQSVLFFNNSKVVKARIPLEGRSVIYRGKTRVLKEGELFYLQPIGNNTYQCYLYPGNKMPKGSQLIIDQYVLDMVDDFERGRVVYFAGDMFALLEHYGQMPLPPYIEQHEDKASHYQPVVSRIPGSVASPTASLHFSSAVLDSVVSQGVSLDYVTLHVGVGTFRPVETPNILDHRIHKEQVEIDIALFQRVMNYKLNNKRTIAVGTTSCRTLESLPYVFVRLNSEYDLTQYMDPQTYAFRDQLSETISSDQACSYIPDQPSIMGSTLYFSCELYIAPGFVFRVIDQLITNFHLPKSSLLVLLATYMGYNPMKQAYQEAIQKNYRFYSFGDAMWIQ
ncbi:MAG: S-adenosylmethionine:tRNA ribosyltransferase-isomerase [Candidatus Absconditabacterales bacterium]